MRFMMMYRPAKDKAFPPSPEYLANMQKYIEQGLKSGVVLATEGLLPSSKGARVTLAAGKLTVTDGPFAEAKELVGGFAIVNAQSKDEAIELAKDFLEVAGDGETEVRQIAEPADLAGGRGNCNQ